jgi:hypothetical protein
MFKNCGISVSAELLNIERCGNKAQSLSRSLVWIKAFMYYVLVYRFSGARKAMFWTDIVEW